MAKPKRSFSKVIEFANVMSTGLAANAAQVAKRGISAEFTQGMVAETTKAQELDASQEKMKADLKLKTKELEESVTKLEGFLSEAKKVVKMDFPKAQWVEFGIQDKR